MFPGLGRECRKQQEAALGGSAAHPLLLPVLRNLPPRPPGRGTTGRARWGRRPAAGRGRPRRSHPPSFPQVISCFQTPHRVSEVSRLFEDNTDLSIDCFPLNEAGTGPQQLQPGAPGLGRGSRRRTGSGRSGFAFSKLSPCPRLLQTQHLPPHVPPRPPSVQADPCPDAHGGPQGTLAARRRIQLPHLSKNKALDPLEVPERPEGTATQMPETLPVIPGECGRRGPQIRDSTGREEKGADGREGAPSPGRPNVSHRPQAGFGTLPPG